jgi:hypothetical protein
MYIKHSLFDFTRSSLKMVFKLHNDVMREAIFPAPVEARLSGVGLRDNQDDFICTHIE